MSEEEQGLKMIRDLIREKSGVFIEDSSLYKIKNRLYPRVIQNKLGSFKDYYFFLKYSENGNREEFSDVINLLINRETYFNREINQLEALKNAVLPQIKESKIGSKDYSVRILSAGCATGEEPYSIAISAAESALFNFGWKVEVVGVDINKRAIETAREGLYEERSLRSLGEVYRDKYFKPEGPGFRLSEDIRRRVIFSNLNLLELNRHSEVYRSDIVFCRNVLIYFDDPTKIRVIKNIFDILLPGGFLFLGHSESLYRLSNLFDLVQLDKAIIYRKKELN